MSPDEVVRLKSILEERFHGAERRSKAALNEVDLAAAFPDFAEAVSPRSEVRAPWQRLSWSMQRGGVMLGCPSVACSPRVARPQKPHNAARSGVFTVPVRPC